jgi:hypothetical protein
MSPPVSPWSAPPPYHAQIASVSSSSDPLEQSSDFRQYLQTSRIVHLPHHTPSPQLPLWAVNEPLQRFAQVHAVLELDKALLMNTPFSGTYYPALPGSLRTPPTNWGWVTHPHRRYDQPQKVALAVFARLDPECNRIWLAAREIYTATTEEGRRSELTWISLENWPLLEKVLMKPCLQVFVPKTMFTSEAGVLDAGEIKAAWLEMIVGGKGVAARG